MGKVTKTISHCTTYKMGRPGFEPGANRLKAEYSTVELATRKQIFFCSHGLPI